MPLFTVMTRGKPPASLEADNWIVAMGLGVELLAGSTAIERLACEMLPNGTVIARDVRSGAGYVIKPDSSVGHAVAAEAAEAAEAAARDSGPGEDREQEIALGDGYEPVDGTTVDSPGLSGVVDDESPVDLTGEDTEAIPAEINRLVERLTDITDAATALVAWETGLDLALEITGAAAGAAVQLTSNNMLFFVAASGPVSERLKAARLPHGTGLVGFCVDRVVGFIVDDVRRDPRHYGAIDEELGFRTRSALLVPVGGDGTLFGCLEVLNAAPRFTAEHLEMMEVLAHTLGERLYRAGLRGRRV